MLDYKALFEIPPNYLFSLLWHQDYTEISDLLFCKDGNDVEYADEVYNE